MPPPKIKRGTTRTLIARFVAEAVAAQPHTPTDDWHRDGACRGADQNLFVPDGQGPPRAAAIAYCAVCPVRLDCATAGAGQRYGIWGGIGRQGRHAVRVAIHQTTGHWPTEMNEADAR